MTPVEADTACLETQLRLPSGPGSGRRRILVVRRGALGDFVLTLPALRALRDFWTGSVEIQLLTLPSYGRMAEHFGFADGWRSIESAPAAALFSRNAALEPEWRDWLAGFDTVVSWIPDPDGTFHGQLMARREASALPLAFHQAPWLAAGDGPAAMQFGRISGVPVRFAAHVLLRREPARVLAKPAVGPVIVALHPGSGSPRKNWPFARWVGMMSVLSEGNPALAWLLITGEAEDERLPEMSAALNAAGIPWESAHAMDLIPLTELLEQCSALLGHDSGISHLASACGVPCFLLFGPTHPDIWAPASRTVAVLRAADGDLSALGVGEVVKWLVGDAGFSVSRL